MLNYLPVKRKGGKEWFRLGKRAPNNKEWFRLGKRLTDSGEDDYASIGK
jgi:hypothetical protein